MNKTSMTPTDAFLGTASLTGGAYAIGELIQELMHQNERQSALAKAKKTPEGALVLDLPAPVAQQAQGMKYASEELPEEFVKRAGELLAKLLAGAIGAPVGLYGTKALYDHMKKKQLDAELAAANAKYFATLEQANKMASSNETPQVDAFCKMAAEHLLKVSGAIDGGMRMLRNFAGLVKAKPLQSAGAAGLAALGAKGFWNDHSPVPAGDPEHFNAISTPYHALKDVANALGWLTALGVGGYGINQLRKADKKSEPRLPDNIALNFNRPTLPPVPETDEEASVLQ